MATRKKAKSTRKPETPFKDNPLKPPKGNDGGSGKLTFKRKSKGKASKSTMGKIVGKKTDDRTDENKKVEEWLQKIDQSLKTRQAWRERFRVDLAYEYRDGEQNPGVPSDEWITVNRIYSNLKSELPTLYSNDPYFFIKLATTYDPDPNKIVLVEQKGKMRQSMLNYLKKELKLKEKVRLSVLDAHFQYGVVKSYYSADMIDNPNAKKETTDDTGNVVLDETGQPIIEPEQLPANESYKIKRVHPDDFCWNSNAGTLEDTWDFLFEIIKMPIEDAKDDKRYNKKARETLQPTERTSSETAQAENARDARKKGTLGHNEPEADTAVMYEVYDLKKNEWFTVSPGSDKFLIKPESVPKGTEKHPYSFLRLGLLRDDSPYPVTPVSQWLDPQKEFNELRSKIQTHRKRFNRKYEMVDTAFDDPDSAASKLENSQDGAVLRRNASFPGQAVFPISDASLDQNHIQELIMLRDDFETLSTGSNQRGAGAGVDSATEAGIIEKRTTIQEGDNLGSVIDFTTDIGRKVDQLVQAFISRDQAVKVTGPQGELWEIIKVSDFDEIDGEYEYSVNTGATVPQLPEIERAQWMQFLGLMVSGPQLALSKTLLKRMAEMHRIEDDSLVDELHNIAKQILGGQVQPGSNGGSPPGQPDMTTMTPSIAGGTGAGISNIRGGAG
ncbi:hypothetical protein CMI37_15525 [Candidatus Pacearchaeota archaeon]|nr:hypothetical protein [Candidatus Pacearchaeota archaeon]